VCHVFSFGTDFSFTWSYFFLSFFCASQRKGTGGLSAIDLTEQNRTMICLLPTYDAWDTRQVAKLIASKMGSHYLDVLMICFFSTGQKTHHSLGESREYVFYFWGGSAVANPR
jgi:hypothetical protein